MGGLMDVDSEPGKGLHLLLHHSFREGRARATPGALLRHGVEGQARPARRSPIRRAARSSVIISRPHGRCVSTPRTAAGEALDAIRRAAASDPYRVIVFDILMNASWPALDLARAVRDDPAIARTSLVHLLMGGEVPNQEAMRQAGINAYASKPVGQRELFDALAIALAHARSFQWPVRSDSDEDSRPAPPPLSPEQRKRVFRLLLVEDNFLNMKLTMSQLQKLGFEGDSVANGKEALDVLKNGQYPVILMDCQMPVLDGYRRHGRDPPPGKPGKRAALHHRHDRKRAGGRSGEVPLAGRGWMITSGQTDSCRGSRSRAGAVLCGEILSGGEALKPVVTRELERRPLRPPDGGGNDGGHSESRMRVSASASRS